MARATRPVVLVRAEEPATTGRPPQEPPYREVVLGLDPRRPADALVEFAFDAAARRTSALRVIHGWTPPFYYGLDSGFGYFSAAVDLEVGAELAAQEAGVLTDALRPWREKFPGVEVTEQPVVGGPAHHLVEAASGAGLLVVGRQQPRFRDRHAPRPRHPRGDAPCLRPGRGRPARLTRAARALCPTPQRVSGR
ncbi:universal stress protein [Streptomyces sp. NPDC006622]|uniref:universal stress protein n=1 Tax=Streptomyces sp. NPDC006622 TaxID=3155459 RepID=UPI0033AB5EBF